MSNGNGNGKARADDVVRLRDYARVEGDFAAPLVKHDLGLPKHRIVAAIAELVRMGTVRETLPAVRGRFGGPAVYSFVRERVPDNRPLRAPQLDVREPVADLAPHRGEALATTGRPKGWADSPKATRDRQRAGHTVRRKRHKGHS